MNKQEVKLEICTLVPVKKKTITDIGANKTIAPSCLFGTVLEGKFKVEKIDDVTTTPTTYRFETNYL